MNIIGIILICLLLFIICKNFNKTTEHVLTCPTADSYFDKYASQLVENARDSKIKEREDISKIKMAHLEKQVDIIMKKSYSDMTDWILNPHNTFTWENIPNTIGNKVRINSLKEDTPLKISNIQIWGKEIDKNEFKNWAMDIRTTVEVSSTKALKNPIHLKDIKYEVINETNKDPNISKVSCPTDYQMTSCNCYSKFGTCNGATITKDNNTHVCTAYNRIGGATVQAKAICAKFDNDIDLKLVESSDDPPGSDPKPTAVVKCPTTHHLISCNCKQTNNELQSCKGANIEGDKCIAYRNTVDPTASIKAVATCADIPGSEIRSTFRSDDTEENKSMNKSGQNTSISTSSCKINEKLVGCNCYAVSDNLDVSDNKSICRGTQVIDGKCVAESIWNDQNNDRYPVFADATCAKFNVAGNKCIDNKLYETIEGTTSPHVYTPSACITNKYDQKNEYITINLPVTINISRIVIYNVDYNPNKKSTNKLYPIKVDILLNKNINLYAIQKRFDDSLEISSGNPPLPVDISDTFYTDGDVDIGLTNYYKGWHNVHSLQNKSYCRFLEIDNDNKDGTSQKYLSCLNPSNKTSTTKKEITTLVGDNFDPGIPSTQYMADETGNKYEDFCRCVKTSDTRSTLKCIRVDPKNEFYEEFEPADKYLDGDCSKYTGEQLKNISKPAVYNDCEDFLDNSNMYSIDAAFYNENNHRYYIFKNIRMDYNKYVMFCEVDLNHKIIEGYPQFMSRQYWGNLPRIDGQDVFLEHIDEAIYGKNRDVYFISGSHVCHVDLNVLPGNPFKIIKDSGTSKNTLSEYIVGLPETFNTNIKMGFYLNDKITIIKYNRYIEIMFDDKGALVSSPDDPTRTIDNKIPITPYYQNLTNINYRSINTIMAFYNTNQTENNNQWIYIYHNADVYKYNLLTQKFSLSPDFNVSKKISEMYPNLTWTIPRIPKTMIPFSETI